MEENGMRIYWPIGLSKDMPDRTTRGNLLESTLSAFAETIVAPDTTVSVGWMDKTTSLLTSVYLGMVNDVYVVSDILDAEQEGYDAAMVGPHWDPGLAAAREAASIPVTGPGEAGMMIAQTLGRRFAMLTVMEGYVPMIERNITQYGFGNRVIARRPVRRFGMSYENLVEALEGSGREFLGAFEDSARECIEDGADVIVAGGQLFGPIFRKHNFSTIPGTGVPVVDVSACGLKMAETLVTLQRTMGLTTSQHVNAPYRTPPRDKVNQVRSEFLTGRE